jgi:alpha-N-arabinofuranosidase
VHSSFAYTPGVPVLHSRNLVDWRIVGHVLDRREQVDMRGQGISRGIFAPTIRHHDGLFYVITTLIDRGGNFLVTAADPAGPWSDPVWLPEIDGIDPDLFFDHDGRVYIVHNGPPEGEPRYDGHRAIWLRQYDPDARRVVAGSGRVLVNGGVDLAAEPVWIEAPHIFRVGDWYYLFCAEGGTGDNHSEVVFRARNLDEPFVPFEGNPILTQRDLPPERIHPITTAGHADLVQTPAGDWWAVFLATRAYDRRFYNNGRETFLLPVDWRGDWPMILPQGELIPYVGQRPVLGAEQAPGQTLTGNFTWRDDFDAETIDQRWLTLRSFDRSWITLEDGQLRLDALRVGLHSLEQPSFLTRRQQHLRYRASVQLRVPADPDVAAGIAAFQNESHHYFLGVQRGNSGYEIFLEQAAAGAPQRIRTASIDLAAGAPLILAIDGDAGRIGFGYRRPDHPREPAGPATESWLARELDGKLLSTAVAGGFVGTTVGVYARRTPH